MQLASGALGLQNLEMCIQRRTKRFFLFTCREFLGVVMILAWPACVAPVPVESTRESSMESADSMQLNIERSASPWLAYTGSAEEEKAGRTVESSPLDPVWEAMPGLASFAIRGDPLLAIDRTRRKVLLSAAHFDGVFLRPDATRISAPVRLTVGRVRPDSDLARNPSKLVLFLLQSQLVITYGHIGAQLERVNESLDSEGRFRSEWTGKHTFFTSQQQERPLHFAVWFDRRSGRLEIEGL